MPIITNSSLPPGGTLATPTVGSLRAWWNATTNKTVLQAWNGNTWVTIQEEDQMEPDFEIKYTVRSVNSKRLLNEIKTLIDEIGGEYVSVSHLLSAGIYDYSELVHFLEMYFDDLYEQKTITQYDVVADHRNNTPEQLEAGTFNISLRFRQLHCVNLSKIDVQFNATPKKSR